MADSSSAANDRARFKPFVWNPLDGLDHATRVRASFLNDARDVVDGAHTLMQLLAWDEEQVDETHSNPSFEPLFASHHRATIQRFVVAALRMLHDEIEGQCDALSCSPQ